MSELSKVLGTAGAPHQITHEGRTYVFHLLDQARKNALEKRLYQNAREAVYVDREMMSSAEYVERLEKVRELYELGAYGIFGERGAKILQTPKGAILLLETITGETEDDLFPLLTTRAEEVNVLLKTVLNESFSRPPSAAKVASNGHA